MTNQELAAMIFDIQGYSTHDGPGGRTLVFLKGCPLRCYWCCNPEGLLHQHQIMYRTKNCIHCYNCVAACSQKAISVKTIGEDVIIDREKCLTCNTFECVNACYHNSMNIAGRAYTVKQLIDRLNRDRRYWSDNGGVTLGGGEVMAQYSFVMEFLKECRKNYIHVAIETSGYAPEKQYMNVLPYLNFIFMDIKHMDPEVHKAATGVSNELILKNIRNISKYRSEDTQLFVRIPCIIGFNDSEDNITKTANFIREAGVDAVNLLPFHRLGSSKYDQLGMTYSCAEMTPPTTEDMNRIKGYVKSCGVTCLVGSEEL